MINVLEKLANYPNRGIKTGLFTAMLFGKTGRSFQANAIHNKFFLSHHS
jgi:hypothetical protein